MIYSEAAPLITFEELMKEFNETYKGRIEDVENSAVLTPPDEKSQNSSTKVVPPPYIYKPVPLAPKDGEEKPLENSSGFLKQYQAIPLDTNLEDENEDSLHANESTEENLSAESIATSNYDLAEVLRKKLKAIEKMNAELLRTKKEAEELLKQLNIQTSNNNVS